MGLRRTDLSPYSVLISVYDQELPENLNDSLDSMLMQTYPPKEVILVCDGELTNELNIIAKSFQSEYRRLFRIVRTDGHVGAGEALNRGIDACRCEYIVKMDSDDIYTQDVYIENLLETDTVILDVILESGSQDVWDCIYRAVTYDGYIKFYAYASVPRKPIRIKYEIRR